MHEKKMTKEIVKYWVLARNMLHLPKQTKKSLDLFFQNMCVKNICPYEVEKEVQSPTHLSLRKATFAGSPVASWHPSLFLPFGDAFPPCHAGHQPVVNPFPRWLCLALLQEGQHPPDQPPCRCSWSSVQAGVSCSPGETAEHSSKKEIPSTSAMSLGLAQRFLPLPKMIPQAFLAQLSTAWGSLCCWGAL